MKIIFTGTYKSLTNFESDELAPFSVITGKNGSGKSQFIELFKEHSHTKRSEYNFEIVENIFSNRIFFEGLIGPKLVPQENSKWQEKLRNTFSNYRGYNQSKLDFLFFLYNNNISLEQIFDKSVILRENIDKDELLIKIRNVIVDDNSFRISDKSDSFSKKSFLNNVEYNLDEYINIFKSEFNYGEYDKKMFEIVLNVSKNRNKSIFELKETDFFKTPLNEYQIDRPELFFTQIDSLFYNYCKRRDINNINFLNNKEYADNNIAIPDEEFVKIYKEPWNQINDILEKHLIDFKFSGIDRKDFSSDDRVYFHLIKITTKEIIDLEYLSSGEKIIIGLIIKLFIAKYYNENLKAPELIILDEPDSHLHPEMSKLLIDVLNETFVKEFGIKVIMTTHSPSTIALCPEDSIYELKNSPETSLKKVTKDYALDLLTGFIPTLSIDYKNHKQVFVESETDVMYYNTIFNKLNQDNQYPFNLYFISNNNGKGNCDLVKNTVKQIRNSGNRTSFGIIDYDLKNKSSEFIKVHGEDKVYSIENYIYNPIYLAVYFMQEKGANNIFKELEIDETDNYFNIGFKNDEYLQRISDWFFEKYYARFTIKDDEKVNLVEFYFYNKSKIKVPKWFLEFKGHDVEKQLKEIFPSLNNYQKPEGELQKEIIKVMAKCYPLIPQDSVDLIESLTK